MVLDTASWHSEAHQTNGHDFIPSDSKCAYLVIFSFPPELISRATAVPGAMVTTVRGLRLSFTEL